MSTNFYHNNPPPTSGRSVVLLYVLDALEQRAKAGYEKYGTPLMTFNGRDALQDAFEEALDLCMYLAQALLEKNENQEREASEDDVMRLLIPRKRR